MTMGVRPPVAARRRWIIHSSGTFRLAAKHSSQANLADKIGCTKDRVVCRKVCLSKGPRAVWRLGGWAAYCNRFDWARGPGLSRDIATTLFVAANVIFYQMTDDSRHLRTWC